MFYCHAHNVPLGINVYIDMVTYLFSLLDIAVYEFDVSSIRIGKIFHPHALFLTERPIEECIMNRFAVFEQDNSPNASFDIAA
jgi:hypothetical protein